jgi:hypothetical protein
MAVRLDTPRPMPVAIDVGPLPNLQQENRNPRTSRQRPTLKGPLESLLILALFCQNWATAQSSLLDRSYNSALSAMGVYLYLSCTSTSSKAPRRGPRPGIDPPQKRAVFFSSRANAGFYD